MGDVEPWICPACGKLSTGEMCTDCGHVKGFDDLPTTRGPGIGTDAYPVIFPSTRHVSRLSQDPARPAIWNFIGAVVIWWLLPTALLAHRNWKLAFLPSLVALWVLSRPVRQTAMLRIARAHRLH